MAKRGGARHISWCTGDPTGADLSQETEKEAGAAPSPESEGEVRESTSTAAEPAAQEAEDSPTDVQDGDSDSPVEPVAVSADAAAPDKTEAPDADADAGAEVEKKAAEQKARQARVAPLYRAFRGKRSISGRVEKTIKGGYEVRIGRARAFCPHSQIDVHRVDDAESFVGTTQMFLITQLRRGGEDVVVSRRALIEADRREEAAAVRATLIEGSVMLGRVSGLAKFGAFVDLGAGVTGLVHITELSHGRINRVDQAVQVGEAVRVKILSLQDDNDRISLSIRQASEDPWAAVTEAFLPNGVYSGKVLRLADFGAFIELSPGVEALAPASEFPPAVGGWKEGLTSGSEHRWRVLRVDAERRRISLTPAGEGEPTTLPEIAAGVELKGKVQRIESFGVFVWLGPGKVGLMPNVLSGTPPGTDLGQRFPIASEVEVEVAEIDDRGRIRLARKGAQRPPRRSGDGGSSRRDRDRPRHRGPKAERPPAVQVSDSNEGFGSLLADKLKDALG